MNYLYVTPSSAVTSGTVWNLPIGTAGHSFGPNYHGSVLAEIIVYTQAGSFLAHIFQGISMTIRIRQFVLTLVSGSALAIAPFAFASVVVPAISHADECTDSARGAAGNDQPCATNAHTLSCPDGTIVDEENNQCVDLMAGLTKQLQALPPPPSLAGAGGLGSLPGGIPSLGTVNLPDLVLPSVGLGLVPNLNLNLQPQLPSSFNPLNPLGLPPPPDLTPGIPFI